MTRGKNPTVPLPIHDVRYDQVGHWPEMQENKNRCCLCNVTCRATCKKCNVYLCLLQYYIQSDGRLTTCFFHDMYIVCFTNWDHPLD